MVVIWSKLSHPNILKFLGVSGDIREMRFSVVSERMTRSNVVRYIKRNSMNKLELVSALSPLLPDIPSVKFR